jgi:hypothetical protein
VSFRFRSKHETHCKKNDAPGVPERRISEASGEPSAKLRGAIHFAQQQTAPVAGKMPAGVVRLDPPVAKPLKVQGLLLTLCGRLSYVHALVFALAIKDYRASAQAQARWGVRNAG